MTPRSPIARRYRIELRVTAVEYMQITENAERVNMSVSEWIRHSAGKVPRRGRGKLAPVTADSADRKLEPVPDPPDKAA